MVKSTIDDIKDITLERQIRKLAGVIDKQNEVIDSVGDVDARITAVEDSTANNTVQINSVKEDVSKNTIAIENISNRVTNVEESTEAIPGIQTEIDGINKSLISDVTASFDNPSRTLMISVEREASPSIDATVVIPASSETGQYSAGNGITINNYQIAVDTGVVALKTDIPVVPDVSEITTRLDTIDGEITGINTNITNLTNKNTEQDTAINGKVAIAQGTENAGKVLGIGENGNVTPVDGSSGGGDNWVLTDKPILELAKLTYGSQYNTFEIFQDFKVVLIGNENNYTYYFEHTFSKGKINLGNNTSFFLINEFCNYTSTSNALSFRNGKLGQFVVNNNTATQSVNETEIIATNTSKYRLYIKSST